MQWLIAVLTMHTDRLYAINTHRLIVFAQSWYDEFLSWDEEKYGGLHEILVEKNEVWSPDLLVENT